MANHAGIYVVDGERQRKDDGKGWIKVNTKQKEFQARQRKREQRAMEELENQSKEYIAKTIASGGAEKGRKESSPTASMYARFDDLLAQNEKQKKNSEKKKVKKEKKSEAVVNSKKVSNKDMKESYNDVAKQLDAGDIRAVLSDWSDKYADKEVHAKLLAEHLEGKFQRCQEPLSEVQPLAQLKGNASEEVAKFFRAVGPQIRVNSALFLLDTIAIAVNEPARSPVTGLGVWTLWHLLLRADSAVAATDDALAFMKSKLQQAKNGPLVNDANKKLHLLLLRSALAVSPRVALHLFLVLSLPTVLTPSSSSAVSTDLLRLYDDIFQAVGSGKNKKWKSPPVMLAAPASLALLLKALSHSQSPSPSKATLKALNKHAKELFEEVAFGHKNATRANFVAILPEVDSQRAMEVAALCIAREPSVWKSWKEIAVAHLPQSISLMGNLVAKWPALIRENPKKNLTTETLAATKEFNAALDRVLKGEYYVDKKRVKLTDAGIKKEDVRKLQDLAKSLEAVVEKNGPGIFSSVLSGGSSERSMSLTAVVVLVLTFLLCVTVTLVSYSYLNNLLPPPIAEKVHRGLSYCSGLLGFKEQKINWSKPW